MFCGDAGIFFMPFVRRGRGREKGIQYDEHLEAEILMYRQKPAPSPAKNVLIANVLVHSCLFSHPANSKHH